MHKNFLVFFRMSLSRIQILAAIVLRRRHRRRKHFQNVRRWWVHPINAGRKQYGAYFALYPQLLADPEKYFNYFRMDQQCFETLHNLIKSRLLITKMLTHILYYNKPLIIKAH